MQVRLTLKISEIFYSIQGEGSNTGVAMAFVRLAGCNLNCSFCDTKYAFNSGDEMATGEIIKQIKAYNPKWVCITGGEPFLQDLSSLVDKLSRDNLKTQIETNGTLFQPIDCDWLVMSPKAEMEPDSKMLARANEIKLVISRKEDLVSAKKYEKLGINRYLQPASNNKELTNICIDYIKENNKWRLSMQVHKFIGIR